MDAPGRSSAARHGHLRRPLHHRRGLKRWRAADLAARPSGVVGRGTVRPTRIGLDLDPTSVPAPASIDLAPLREAGIPTVDEATFADRLDRLHEHRRRLAAFAVESVWHPRSTG